MSVLCIAAACTEPNAANRELPILWLVGLAISVLNNDFDDNGLFLWNPDPQTKGWDEEGSFPLDQCADQSWAAGFLQVLEFLQ